jgi:hypothetical protein
MDSRMQYTEETVETFVMSTTKIQIHIHRDVAQPQKPKLTIMTQEEPEEIKPARKQLEVKFLAEQIAKYHSSKGKYRYVASWIPLFSSSNETSFITAITDFLNKARPNAKKRDGFFTDEETLQFLNILSESQALDTDNHMAAEFPDSTKFKVEPNTESHKVREALYAEVICTFAAQDYLSKQLILSELSPSTPDNQREDSERTPYMHIHR